MLHFAIRFLSFTLMACFLATVDVGMSKWQYWAIMGLAVFMSAHSYITGQLDGVKASVKKAYEVAYADFMKIVTDAGKPKE